MRPLVFSEGSVNALVNKKLKELAEGLRSFSEGEAGEEKEKNSKSRKKV
jgi:hypothetical protein